MTRLKSRYSFNWEHKTRLAADHTGGGSSYVYGKKRINQQNSPFLITLLFIIINRDALCLQYQRGGVILNYKELCDELVRILNLDLPPVGVKFLKTEELEAFQHYKSDVNYTFCQFIMRAQEGEQLLANGDNIACANGASALGFKPIPDKLKTGEFLEKLGSFEKEAGRTAMKDLPRFELNRYAAIAVSQVANADFEPDVISIQGKPEHLMWLTLSVLHHEGGRLNFSTAISNGCCVDITVIPQLEQRLNVSLGCYGCRNATSIPDEHLLAGFPGQQLESMVNSLRSLEEKTIPRTRDKKAYNRLINS